MNSHSWWSGQIYKSWTSLNLKSNSKPWRERHVGYHHHKLLFTSSNIFYPCSNLLKLFNASIIVYILLLSTGKSISQRDTIRKTRVQIHSLWFYDVFFLKNISFSCIELRLNWLYSFMQSLLNHSFTFSHFYLHMPFDTWLQKSHSVWEANG